MARLTPLVERYLPLLVLATAVLGAPMMILSPRGLPRLRGLEQDLSDVTQVNDDLRRQIERLRARVARLRDDPAAVERIARDRLGLARQTEVIFQFPRERPARGER